MQIIVRNSYEPPAFERPSMTVYFDVFRASTTLLALISQRPARLLSANDVATVRAWQAEGYTLVSEVLGGGLDNSPTQVLAEPFEGRRVIHKSANMTSAIFHRPGSARELVGGFGNASRLAAYIRDGGFATVELVAASHFARRTEALEDLICARMVACLIVSGGAPVVDLSPIHAAVADKRARRGAGAQTYYFADVELALRCDTMPFLVEIRRLGGATVELAEIDGA